MSKRPIASKLQLLRAICGWLMCALLALVFLSAGTMKLLSRPNMVSEFAKVGLGQWFRYFTGILEVTGAIGLLIPPLARWAAMLLVVVMSGAIVAHLTALHSPPVLPAILLVMAIAAAWLRKS